MTVKSILKSLPSNYFKGLRITDSRHHKYVSTFQVRFMKTWWRELIVIWRSHHYLASEKGGGSLVRVAVILTSLVRQSSVGTANSLPAYYYCMQWSRTHAQVLFEFVNGSIMDEICLRGICASQKSISMDKYYLTIIDMILPVTY